MAKLQDVIQRGTNAARPAATAVPVGTLYYDTTNSSLARSSGTAWESVEGAGGLADQGTATYLDFTTAAAPANPAAGKIRVYSKTGDTLAQRTSGGTETVFGAGGGGNAFNENDAAALVNATSAGDAGSRATGFPGTAIPAAWVQEATAAAATAVKYSSFGLRTTGQTHYLQAYTPSGAFRVEARVRKLAGSFGIGILIRDSGTGDASGEGMLIAMDENDATLYSLDAGVYTARGAASVIFTDGWIWLALARDGSNQWNAYVSADRALWSQVGTANYAKTFTVAKGGIRVDTATTSIDVWDVVS